MRRTDWCLQFYVQLLSAVSIRRSHLGLHGPRQFEVLHFFSTASSFPAKTHPLSDAALIARARRVTGVCQAAFSDLWKELSWLACCCVPSRIHFRGRSVRRTGTLRKKGAGARCCFSRAAAASWLVVLQKRKEFVAFEGLSAQPTGARPLVSGEKSSDVSTNASFSLSLRG